MNRFTLGSIVFCLLVIFFCHGATSEASDVVAFSLREAVHSAQKGDLSSELRQLGGITRIGAMVFDRKGSDLILIGLAHQELPAVSFDDLVVALRTRLLYDTWPLVSIDPLPETEKTKLQAVRFGGQIANTAFGRSFLDADILLKRYSLQLAVSIPEVPSYRVLLEDDIRKSTEASGERVLGITWQSGKNAELICADYRGKPIKSSTGYQARFWFYVKDPLVFTDRNDVFGIKQLQLALKSEWSRHEKQIISDSARERFTKAWTDHFDGITMAYPVLRRLKVLYDLTAIAEAIRKIEDRPDLSFLLDDYIIKPVPTEATYQLEEMVGVCARTDDLNHIVRVSGGIDFRVKIRDLNDGDFTPLREIVLKSRPSPKALSWVLPIDGWRMQNARDLEPDDWKANSASNVPGGIHTKGCSVGYQSYLLDSKSTIGKPSFSGFETPNYHLPPLKGISMKMVISNGSYRQPTDGKLDGLRNKALETRPRSKSLFWKGGRKNE